MSYSEDMRRRERRFGIALETTMALVALAATLTALAAVLLLAAALLLAAH